MKKRERLQKAMEAPRRTRRHSTQTEFYVNSPTTRKRNGTIHTSSTPSAPTPQHHKKSKKGTRPADKAGWQQRWTKDETKSIFEKLLDYNQTHPNATALEKQRHLADIFPDRSFHGIVNKYALEVNRAKGKREDPYPELKELRKRAMSAHSSKHPKSDPSFGHPETSAELLNGKSGKQLAAAPKKCSKFGPLLMRLRQLVQLQRNEMDNCTRAVMEVAGDAQVVRDELAASLVLSR